MKFGRFGIFRRRFDRLAWPDTASSERLDDVLLRAMKVFIVAEVIRLLIFLLMVPVVVWAFVRAWF